MNKKHTAYEIYYLYNTIINVIEIEKKTIITLSFEYTNTPSPRTPRRLIISATVTDTHEGFEDENRLGWALKWVYLFFVF